MKLILSAIALNIYIYIYIYIYILSNVNTVGVIIEYILLIENIIPLLT